LTTLRANQAFLLEESACEVEKAAAIIQNTVYVDNPNFMCPRDC